MFARKELPSARSSIQKICRVLIRENFPVLLVRTRGSDLPMTCSKSLPQNYRRYPGWILGRGEKKKEARFVPLVLGKSPPVSPWNFVGHPGIAVQNIWSQNFNNATSNNTKEISPISGEKGICILALGRAVRSSLFISLSMSDPRHNTTRKIIFLTST